MALAAQLDNVCIHIGDKPILRNIHCDIDAGVVTALVGESGCGKSTLLHTLNGLFVPTSGKLSVLGEQSPVSDLVSFRLRMGFAIQNAALMPHMNIFDNLTIMARLAGWPKTKITDRFNQLMDLLELDSEFSTSYPHQLSGGQQQRVSIGRAFMLNPEMLLLDEPFSAIDPITRTGIYARFEALLQVTPKSVVIVTHDLKEARRLADQLIVMRAGQVVQTGSFDAIRNQPANDYVAQLFSMVAD